MDAVIERCAGLDVHQASVVACLLTGELDQKPKKEIKTFGTTTQELRSLRDWLESQQISHVAMESTGVYWVPVWNVLEGSRLQLILANAQFIKSVPGRKTDMKDAVWIAQLLRCGLIRGSFVPPETFRYLRSYSRYRIKLVGQVTAEKNRILKVLETANIKLATFLSDVFGTSGTALLQAIIDGEVLDVAQVQKLVYRNLKAKVPSLVEALNGRVSSHHRELIRMHLEHMQFLQQQIARLECHIHSLLAPFQEELQLLNTIPGVDETAATIILSETGIDMSNFQTDAHFSSWAGVCPGNHESAGKKKSTRTPKGKRVLRSILCQCAWAAAFSTDTRIKSFYDRVLRRRGKKKANMAVAHLLLRLIYWILKTKQAYNELGYHYLFKERSPVDNWIKKLKALGYEVNPSLQESS